MPLMNTPTGYGSVSRVLHWLTALLVFVAFPLGFLANRAPITTDPEIARAFALFSLHKTVGVMALVIGLLRIVWWFAQRRPAPLHPERRVETFLAATVHWTLSIALIAVPLTGWLSHSAAPGLAPIRWPFGQSLPFVSADPAVAALFGTLHWWATKLLGLAILLHVAGALKHVLIDHDATLARMWRGTTAGGATAGPMRAPFVIALLLWAAVLAASAVLSPEPQPLAAAGSGVEWPITDGTLEIIQEKDSAFVGTIAAWNATLILDPSATGPAIGTLDLFAALDSLDEGSDAVTADLLIPVLTFTGTISRQANALTATGPLDIDGESATVTVSITLDGDAAQITGNVALPAPPDFRLNLNLSANRAPE
jgi:cytochrome b561